MHILMDLESSPFRLSLSSSSSVTSRQNERAIEWGEPSEGRHRLVHVSASPSIALLLFLPRSLGG